LRGQNVRQVPLRCRAPTGWQSGRALPPVAPSSLGCHCGRTVRSPQLGVRPGSGQLPGGVETTHVHATVDQYLRDPLKAIGVGNELTLLQPCAVREVLRAGRSVVDARWTRSSYRSARTRCSNSKRRLRVRPMRETEPRNRSHMRAEVLNFGSQGRRFLLAEPLGAPSVIVLGLHGSGSSPKRQARLSSMERFSSSGAVVAFPQGAWPLRSGFEWDLEGDVEYLGALVSWLHARYPETGPRVCIAGMSGRARMASRFASLHPGSLRLLGAVAGLRAPTRTLLHTRCGWSPSTGPLTASTPSPAAVPSAGTKACPTRPRRGPEPLGCRVSRPSGAHRSPHANGLRRPQWGGSRHFVRLARSRPHVARFASAALPSLPRLPPLPLIPPFLAARPRTDLQGDRRHDRDLAATGASA
jgi:poly(3-hydroxybutyrate) depolymerase